MRSVLIALLGLVSLCLASEAQARPHLLGRNREFQGITNAARTVATAPVKAIVAGENATAQGVANIMARIGRVGHHGGNSGYEGCGMAGTKDGAYRICCYANSGMKTVDVGYAQGSNGMWFCCRRYIR